MDESVRNLVNSAKTNWQYLSVRNKLFLQLFRFTRDFNFKIFVDSL